MAFKQINVRDAELREVQQNTADAFEEVGAARLPPVAISQVSTSGKLVGNEDIVLVDASIATKEIILILPGVKVLTRRTTVKVRKAGSVAVTLRPVDIADTGSPKINEVAAVSIPAGSTTSITVFSDGRNYWTE